MDTLFDLFDFMPTLLGFLLANFLIFSTGGHLLFYKILAPHIAHRKIHQKDPGQKQIKTEILNSLKTHLVFFAMGLGLWSLWRAGWTQIYQDLSEKGIGYYLLSFWIIQLFHDTYFYWTHRWMHEWKWLRPYHNDHHRSFIPTPFAALSFHPVEAISHGLFWYLIALLIPLHFSWLFIFYSFMYYINMWGHTGYEFWHKDLLTRPIQKILNTPTHHNLHHKYHNYNYGIYYNFWDKLCGTNHPLYEKEYKEIKERTEKYKTNFILKKLGL
jgi:Delta7-sterol 5-desaturase